VGEGAEEAGDSDVDDMRAAFPLPQPTFGMVSGGIPRERAAALKVHDVGSFEASFVPRLRDFSRLDARFRLPDATWASLPQYADWGFAVFKLKATGARQNVHPMAFWFPRRDVSQLFFPTLHVHDGRVQQSASFDHELYCQTPTLLDPQWQRSPHELGHIVHGERARGLVDWSAHGHKRVILGMQPNQDTVVTAADSVPPLS
jgi:hypothetical protein